MANLKQSKKASRPPLPIPDSKRPTMAKKTESPADVRANLQLSRGRAKGIAAHIRATAKRHQGKCDAR